MTIFSTKFESWYKFFSPIKLVSLRKLAPSRNAVFNHIWATFTPLIEPAWLRAAVSSSLEVGYNITRRSRLITMTNHEPGRKANVSRNALHWPFVTMKWISIAKWNGLYSLPYKGSFNRTDLLIRLLMLALKRLNFPSATHVGLHFQFAGEFWELWEHSDIIRLNQAFNAISKDWSAS